ncbi:hypothetical protein COCSADRAFT_289448 [Bipolaris sorokiniana ND90Pr]|uniref:Uncharacterized protein n=1 Tax=Cochliobolus sativus (strain ND90Pr / ATCC 201652) TaxID=665912 RepID=M2TDY9_COCSN|nr:uncharacterized protein COCSADRAFT_289448 [Bipolaris sorokiniana ND90Pr]EMD67456.1 hypothetical protein COCSADRAFT_289448 [Bipolaris sorokiniana ND90Pr]
MMIGGGWHHLFYCHGRLQGSPRCTTAYLILDFFSLWSLLVYMCFGKPVLFFLLQSLLSSVVSTKKQT